MGKAMPAGCDYSLLLQVKHIAYAPLITTFCGCRITDCSYGGRMRCGRPSRLCYQDREKVSSRVVPLPSLQQDRNRPEGSKIAVYPLQRMQPHYKKRRTTRISRWGSRYKCSKASTARASQKDHGDAMHSHNQGRHALQANHNRFQQKMLATSTTGLNERPYGKSRVFNCYIAWFFRSSVRNILSCQVGTPVVLES